ncbi:DUF4843 domain-containing protein [Thermonema rossianum]|uniref:DUF4843 domain-containing protein n=1 Tax=Thermonema rossianum TaxID=55505 RepID=UPI0005718855|nr:DUF4843 domain-containing protein [Thermonema rossianum]
MKKILYTIGLFLTGAALLSSCMEDPGTTIKYEGKPFVEFDILTSGSSLSPDVIDINQDGLPVEKSLKINLVGKLPEQDVTITVAVLPDSSTAVEGVHYNLPSKEITIPAGETSGELKIEILDDNLTELYDLYLVLEGGGEYVPAENFKNLRYTFGTCPFDINTFIGTYDCLEPGYATYEVNFSLVSGTTLKNDNFWDVGAEIDYVFASDGASVTIPTQTFGSYEVDGSSPSKPNTCDGSFKVDYQVRSGGAVIDDNTHTFTKK